MRNSTIYVGYSIFRKTDTRLSKGDDAVVCLPGARIEHVTERERYIADHGKRKGMFHTGTHRDEQRRQGRNGSDSGEVQEPTEEDDASKGWTDHLIRNVTCVWKRDPRIYRQQDGGATLQGRGRGIRGFV